MKTAFFSLCLLFGGVVAAQTKLISYKSHSGSGPLFAAAYANNLFDMEDSDFGTPPARPVNRIDS